MRRINIDLTNKVGMMILLCREIHASLVLFLFLFFISRGMKGEQLHPATLRLALLGSSARLECKIGETNSEFTISWFANDDHIFRHSSNQWPFQNDGNYRSVIERDKSNASLLISNITFKDSGLYNCSVNFHSAGKSRRSSWIVNVQGLPKIKMPPLLIEEEPSMVECCVEVAFVRVLSETEIVWRMDGEILHSQIFPAENGTKSVKGKNICNRTSLNLNQHDHGNKLQCFARNELNASTQVNLNVMYLEKVDVKVGSIYNPTHEVHVGKDVNINITCVSYGYPSSNISIQRLTKESNWINVPLKAYSVKQNMTMTSRTFLYISTNENSDTFRCIANNDIGLTKHSKEFQITAHDGQLSSATSQDPKSSSDPSGDYKEISGSNKNQTLLVVCIGMAIVITLIWTNRSRESININPCRLTLTNLRRRGRDDSIYTDMSQGVPDVCRDPSGTTQAENSVFYYVLERDDYETVECDNDGIQRTESIAIDAGNEGVYYAKVNKMKTDENAREMKKPKYDINTYGEKASSDYTDVQRLK